MSVDAQITLPGFVAIRNVADAIGILAGNERHIQTLHGSAGDFQVVRVDGVETKGSSVGPECADIAIRRGNETLLYVLYHFEWKYTGERGLMPPARPEWLAIGKGLVDLFGGTLDYSDWDDVVDYEVEPRTELANLNDDATFERMQRALMDLRPLVQADVNAMKPHAAYEQTVQFSIAGPSYV